MLGCLGSLGEDNDSNESSKHGEQNTEIELSAGGLDRIDNDNRDQPGGRYGGSDGSGLDPVQLDLEEVSNNMQQSESENPGGGRFDFQSWHVDTRENALEKKRIYHHRPLRRIPSRERPR